MNNTENKTVNIEFEYDDETQYNENYNHWDEEEL